MGSPANGTSASIARLMSGSRLACRGSPGERDSARQPACGRPAAEACRPPGEAPTS